MLQRKERKFYCDSGCMNSSLPATGTSPDQARMAMDDCHICEQGSDHSRAVHLCMKLSAAQTVMDGEQKDQRDSADVSQFTANSPVYAHDPLQ